MEKNPRGTRVFKTRVSPFYFPSSSSCSSNPGFFFVHIWRSNRPIGAPTFFVLPLFIVPLQICSSSNLSSYSSSGLCSIVQSKLQRSSSFVLPLFIILRHYSCSSSNRSSCSSSSLFFFKYQNRVLETRFCFLELESIRLKIYLASYFQLTKWESSL